MNFDSMVIDCLNSFYMKKEISHNKISKAQSLNCRIGRYFVPPGYPIYGKNASASVKNTFSPDGNTPLRNERYCRIKPLMFSSS
jgi:hypothetical protein